MANSCYPYNSRLLGSTEVSLAEVIYKGTDKVDKPLEGRLAEPKSVSLLLYMELYIQLHHTRAGGVGGGSFISCIPVSILILITTLPQ